ncbi:MAG TPA: hypothetical protein VE575_11945 [Acidimicrobiales bacterium]|jgi:hypothetical protein|nr:hypothetical protein [Acidimicrobiales bacterium]
MSQRRLVRVAPSFFDRLDELLPGGRTAAGQPSATDFLLHELPRIIDRLAQDYESVTLAVPSRPGLRVLITAGALVPTVAVYTVLAADGAVEIISLDIDQPPN